MGAWGALAPPRSTGDPPDGSECSGAGRGARRVLVSLLKLAPLGDWLLGAPPPNRHCWLLGDPPPGHASLVPPQTWEAPMTHEFKCTP